MALSKNEKSKMLYTLVLAFISRDRMDKYLIEQGYKGILTSENISPEEYLIDLKIIPDNLDFRQYQSLMLELGIRPKEYSFESRQSAIIEAFLLHEYPLVMNHKDFIVDALNILSELECMYNPNTNNRIFRRGNSNPVLYIDTSRDGLCKSIQIIVKEKYNLRQWYQDDNQLIYQLGFHFHKWEQMDFYTSPKSKHVYWFKTLEERYRAIINQQNFFSTILLCYKNWD